MKEIREAFHTILNQLNYISVKSGEITELAKLRDTNTMSEEETKEAYKKALDRLSLVQDYTLETGKAITELKKKVYQLLKIDPSKPIE